MKEQLQSLRLAVQVEFTLRAQQVDEDAGENHIKAMRALSRLESQQIEVEKIIDAFEAVWTKYRGREE